MGGVVEKLSATTALGTGPVGRGSLSWFDDERFIGRSLGWLFVIWPLTALAGLAFPQPRYAVDWLMVVPSVLAMSIGLALLAGVFNRVPRGVYPALVYLAIALVTVAVYASGAPGAGTRFYYLWITPYAFVFFSRRQAVTQTLLVAACWLGALAVFVYQHPSVGPFTSFLGMWFAGVMTAIVVGVLVRRLTSTLRHADLRFRRGFDSATVGFAFVSLDRVVLDVNDALCRIVGRPREELIGRHTGVFWHPGDTDNVAERVATAVETPAAVELEARVVRPDGAVRWVAMSSALVSPEGDRPYYYALVRDITEQRRDREMLAAQAIHDRLTGLYNRTLLMDRLEVALERHRGGVAVLLIDVDRFRLVNDSLGHHVGDEILTALGRRLTSAVQHGDTVARFGGDEFAVLCENVRDPMDALARASGLTRALEEPLRLTSGAHLLAASVGVAVAKGRRVNAAGLLADADAALHRAKARGRGRVEMFDESLRAEVRARLELERELRRAVDTDQFFVEYQPTVDTYSGRPTGLEALVRWRHPRLGIVSPADFIPVAEDTGLITKIGEWVLQRASSDLAAWQAAVPMDPPVRVAVNVSGRQLATTDFTKTVRCAVGSGIAPGTLGLEITESLLLNTDDDLHARLVSLKELGVRLLLDDFGTGYSSLAYLKRFPMDVLKIDRSFIDGLGIDQESSAIVEAIIKMAAALDLEVVAEGLESECQLEELRRLGCDRVQGFVISPPLPPEKVEGFLREQFAVSEASAARASAWTAPLTAADAAHDNGHVTPVQ